VKSTNEFHNPIGAFRRKVDYNHDILLSFFAGKSY